MTDPVEHTPAADAIRASVSASRMRFWTSSNVLSITRALLTIPFVFVMFSAIPERRIWGAGIMVIAALTDKLDGMLARKFGEITEWGKILDPVADKIAVAVAAGVLVALGSTPLWFVLTIIGRDAAIFTGGIYLKSKYGLVLPSNETGKWAVGIISLTLFLMLIDTGGIVLDLLVIVSVLLLALSLGFYVERFMRVTGMIAPKN